MCVVLEFTEIHPGTARAAKPLVQTSQVKANLKSNQVKSSQPNLTRGLTEARSGTDAIGHAPTCRAGREATGVPIHAARAMLVASCDACGQLPSDRDTIGMREVAGPGCWNLLAAFACGAPRCASRRLTERNDDFYDVRYRKPYVISK